MPLENSYSAEVYFYGVDCQKKRHYELLMKFEKSWRKICIEQVLVYCPFKTHLTTSSHSNIGWILWKLMSDQRWERVRGEKI